MLRILSFSPGYMDAFRKEIVKPWSDFRNGFMVFDLQSKSKNPFEKVPFLLVRFLWASKENDHIDFSKALSLVCITDAIYSKNKIL